MIVIGSRALAYHYHGVKPNDLDLVGTYDEAKAFTRKFGAKVFYPINSGKTLFMKNEAGFICEIEIAWPGSRAEGFLKFAEQHYTEFVNMNADGWLVPGVDVLYMLKMSHRYLKDSPHFLKTMRDIQMLRKDGARITEAIHPYYLKRMAETYTYKHPKLDVSKENFFDAEATGVEYTYDHDSIHEAVAVGDRPAYTYFKPEDSPVLCDRKLFEMADRRTQLSAVLEESYVLALERSLVPFPNGLTPKQAFDMALMKVCTSITSGWFREFAWENYDYVQALYATEDIANGADCYVKKFEAGLTAGVVKPFKGKVY